MPTDTPATISAMTLVAFAGGLSLFLIGIDRTTAELKLLAGDRLRSLLVRFTSNRISGALSGAILTALIQSSSVTSVLAVSFVSAGLITLQQAIPVMIGASIGTTITSQIIAFKVANSAYALIAVGFVTQLAAVKPTHKQFGGTLLGLGLLFLGMNVMSGSMAPLKDDPQAVAMLQHLDSPFVAILIASGFTAIVQSSSATVGLIIVMAGQNLITLPQAIPLILGANIGTCATALLSTIGKPRSALQAALSNLIFHVTGVIIWYGLYGYLPAVVRWITNDTMRQVAHAHTLINAVQGLAFLGLVSPTARLAAWLVPDRPIDQPQVAQPKYLDPVLLGTPALALEAARMDLCRMGIAALQMVRRSLVTVVRGNQAELDRLESMDESVDALHGEIVTYLGLLAQKSALSTSQSRQLHDNLLIANYFENIGDMIESNLVPLGRRRLRMGLVVSQETESNLERLHRDVQWAMERSIRGFADKDIRVAQEVVNYKPIVQSSVLSVERQLASRLTADGTLRLTAFRLESEILEHLKRVYYFVKRIAHILIDESQASDSSPVQGTPTPEEPGTHPPDMEEKSEAT